MRDKIPDEMQSRRGFLLAGMGVLLAGCATTGEIARVPGPAWDAHPLPAAPPPSAVGRVNASYAGTPARSFASGGVRARSAWAAGQPVPALMDRMRPIRYITVHHDGMQPFYGNDERSATGRLEAIRRGHRREQWGDIGYHFAVDRSGVVWECRPLAFQGAHVKDHNEGNVGILVMGNFDHQQPTPAQCEAVRQHLRMLMRYYRVSPERIRTHQEWANTACPGRSLQRYMTQVRTTGGLA